MYYQLKNRIVNGILVLFIIGLSASCKPERNDLDATKFLIDSIQSQVIRDSRIELFAIKASWLGDSVLVKGKTTKPEAAINLCAQLTRQEIPFIDSILRLPDANLGDKNWGLITLSVANMRSTPANSAEMATQALLGTPVRILQEEDGWLLVQTPDKYISWTQTAGVKKLTQNELNEWKASERLLFQADYGLITNANGEQPISDVVMGSVLVRSENSQPVGLRIQVVLPDGRSGYIKRADCVDFRDWYLNVLPTPENLVKNAAALMGRPYLWGGTSGKGMDCSGLTKTVYFTGGLVLSRDASQQVLQGVEVDLSDVWKSLKPGDLLFFGRKATDEKPEGVTHVGMYTGESDFIHSSVSAGMTSVYTLDSTRADFKPYYLTNLLHVRRIIGMDNSPIPVKEHPWYN